MQHVITLTGPSGAGKSTLIEYMLSMSSPGFSPVVIPKYTTRSPRKGEATSTIETNIYSEIICVSEMLPPECNLVYEQYGVRYGLQFDDIYKHLAKRQTPIVILNDIRTVEDVRNAFEGIVKSIFVFRESPSLETFSQLAVSRGNFDPVEVNKRFQKAQSIYRIYIENIHLFDHVALNFGDISNLWDQAGAIINSLQETHNWPLKED